MQPISKKRKRVQSNGGARNGGLVHPPQLQPTIVVPHKFRFKATAASASDLVATAALGDLLCTTPTAATGFQLANFFRIRKVEMWAPMASDLVPVTCQLEWSGFDIGVLGKSTRVSDTSMGANQPAHIVTRPPPGSQVGMWQRGNSTTNLVFSLAYPANTIIDVTLDLVLRDDAIATAVTGAVAGATVGAIYCRALNSPVNNNLVPVGLSTI